MTFWNVFFGVFAGIISGVLINLFIDFVKDRVIKKRIKKNLKFEIDFNLKKIDSFLEELNEYRNKVNADCLNNYFGYFNLSKIISITMFQMFNNGLVYKYLNHEDIAVLQNFLSDFSFGTENYMNNQIKWNKDNHSNPDIKQIASEDISFWEKKFKENKKMIGLIKEKL